MTHEAPMTGDRGRRLLTLGIGLLVVGCAAAVAGTVASVIGMVDSFAVIAGSDSAPAPSQLASGVSAALAWRIAGIAVGGVLVAVGLLVTIVWAVLQAGRRDEATTAAEAGRDGEFPAGWEPRGEMQP
jgi:hypothetical protein